MDSIVSKDPMYFFCYSNCIFDSCLNLCLSHRKHDTFTIHIHSWLVPRVAESKQAECNPSALVHVSPEKHARDLVRCITTRFALFVPAEGLVRKLTQLGMDGSISLICEERFALRGVKLHRLF